MISSVSNENAEAKNHYHLMTIEQLDLELLSQSNYDIPAPHL